MTVLLLTLLAGWLLANELLPLGLLLGTVPFESCPGRRLLPPRTRVRAGLLPVGDGGYTVVLGPWRWVVVAVGLPPTWLPALVAHESAHIRRGHPRKLWLLAVLCAHRSRWARSLVARWEWEVDGDVDAALGLGTGIGLRLALLRHARVVDPTFEEVSHEAQG